MHMGCLYIGDRAAGGMPRSRGASLEVGGARRILACHWRGAAEELLC